MPDSVESSSSTSSSSTSSWSTKKPALSAVALSVAAVLVLTLGDGFGASRVLTIPPALVLTAGAGALLAVASASPEKTTRAEG